MKKSVSFFLIFALFFTLFSTSCSKIEEYKAPDVCLDAGHGGEDYGSVYNNRYEKNDNMKMVNAIKRELERKKIKTVLTRHDDEFVSLQERTRVANQSNAKLLVSIHRNSGEGAKGVEVWINSKNIWEDRVLAENILKNLNDTGISKDRGIKTDFQASDSDDYYINDKTEIPSCIVELGFINNAQDNAMFSEDNIDKYAEAIADAIQTTLNDIGAA